MPSLTQRFRIRVRSRSVASASMVCSSRMISSMLTAAVGGEVADDPARDGVPRGADRHRVAREPARVLQLLAVDGDLAARVARHEADHDLARERPVLAPHVLDVLDVDADLFLHLARHAALERLAVVDEARHQRVAARGPDRLAREQHPVAVAHEHDDRGVQVRVVLVAAAAAALAPLALETAGAARRSAGSARWSIPSTGAAWPCRPP